MFLAPKLSLVIYLEGANPTWIKSSHLHTQQVNIAALSSSRSFGSIYLDDVNNPQISMTLHQCTMNLAMALKNVRIVMMSPTHLKKTVTMRILLTIFPSVPSKSRKWSNQPLPLFRLSQLSPLGS